MEFHESQGPGLHKAEGSFEAQPLPHWYEARNNWRDCELRMLVGAKRISDEFTGKISKEERLIQETKLQKAADDLFWTSGGRLGHRYEPETAYVEVADIFRDWHFPGDTRSWNRGGDLPSVDYDAPNNWQRLYEYTTGPPYPLVDPNAGNMNPRMGRVYQGKLEDYYIVQALMIIGMKGQLVRNVFANMQFSDPSLGFYILRFYKNAQWVDVEIDDALPMTSSNEPLCANSEFFPDYAWPSLIEKAYAKLHGSWESLGGGGHVEEVLTDLTGGCASRFRTGDVAGDRLWKYLHELQRFCVWGCSISVRECAKRMIPIEKHWASAIYSVTKDLKGIPYIGVFTAAPTATVRHFPLCDLPMEEGYGITDGFAWLRIDDFCAMFDTIYECRLVNSDLGPPPVSGILWTPGYVPDSPLFERVWAYKGYVGTEATPCFLTEVHHAPLEIILEASQADARYSLFNKEPENERHMQTPLLVRFYQCSNRVSEHTGGEIYLVHMSSWAHTRDATCVVKVMRPGKYMAMVSMPANYGTNRMIFRTYSSSRQLQFKPITQDTARHVRWIAVNPGMPLHAIPYSLAGWPRIDAVNERLPQMFDEEEGKGKPLTGWKRQVQKLELRAGLVKDQDRAPGLKVVGKFGGPNAQATVMAKEDQAVGCSAM